MKKKNALGRGLEALLEDSSIMQESELLTQAANVNEIPLRYIETNPFQPRTHFDLGLLEELADSIRTQGIIQPITLRKISKNKYQIISGERRFQASKLIGLETIPAYVRSADDQQMLEMALVENIQRENLNALEIALSYQRLLNECNLKQEELGNRVGKKRTTVNNYLRLLKLPPDIQAALKDNKISMGHARALINVENVEDQLAIFNKIEEGALSVRHVEELVRNLLTRKSKQIQKPVRRILEPEFERLETTLSSHFGTKITILKRGKERGSIKIPFYSVEDLNRVLDILSLNTKH